MFKINLIAILAILASVLATPNLHAQSTENLWQTAEPGVPIPGKRRIKPEKYQLLRVDFEDLKSQLRQAPEESFPATNPGMEVRLPMPDGSFQRFAVYSSDIMHKSDRADFPDIRTFVAQGLDDPRAHARIDFTPHGFHAMILGQEDSYWIDPYAFGNTEYYMAYRKSDLKPRPDEDYTCHSDHLPNDLSLDSKQRVMGAGLPVGPQMLVYELAITCIGEYTQFHGGTVPLAQAAMVTSVNRITGIFERDMGIRLVLVPNNDTLIFTDPNTDPYPCCNLGPILNLGANVIDSLVGFPNYDIGHTFTTYGGGLAAFGVCENAKAIAGTGLNNPIGDPFDVDYVSHEMGHQFHCAHTFNYCPGNGGVPHEPGSGSTIMAYAGLCGSANMQNFSVDAFSVGSYEQAVTFVQQGPGNTCPDVITTGNSAPTVTIPQGGFYIPYSTPFELTAVGSDIDLDSLTYSWEQWDLGPNTHPDTAIGNCPLFRVLWPTPNPQRIFPQITDIVQGTSTIGEKLPEYGREMNFRCAIRDNRGGADFAEMKFFVADSSGPFQVTYPNTNVGFWVAGSIENVTWDVANSNLSPVNCPNVDIYLSTDGGFTYPIVLATGRPNNGATAITVPNILGNNMRVKIKGAGNHFFDISDSDFAILPPSTPDYTLTVNSPVKTLCGQDTTTFLIELDTLGVFTDPVTLSLAGNPGGSGFSFSANPSATPAMVDLLVWNGNAPAGDYTMNLQANSTSGVKSMPLTLRVRTGAPPTVSLASPFNGATNYSLTPVFSWNQVAFASTYHLQVSTTPNFASLLLDVPGWAATSYSLSNALSNSTIYYWRVKVDGSECGSGPWSSVYSFQTPLINCGLYSSTNVPITIPSAAVDTVYSTITIPQSLLITDVNVVDLEGIHTWMDDLYFTVTSPQNTSVGLFGNMCGNNDDFWVSFDDTSSLNQVPCPPTTQLTYQPDVALANFNSENAQGTWTLQIIDRFAQDGGTLNQWALEICGPPFNTSPPTLTNQMLNVNQGASDTITNQYLLANCAGSTSIAVYTVVSLPGNGDLLLNGVALSIGDTFTQGDIDQNLLTYQHNGSGTVMDSFDFTLNCSNGGYIGGLTFNIGINLNVSIYQGENLDLEVFPNPAQDAFTVRASGVQVQTMMVRIYASNGQYIKSVVAPSSESRIELGDYPAGLYHLQVLINGKNSGSLKVVMGM